MQKINYFSVITLEREGEEIEMSIIKPTEHCSATLLSQTLIFQTLHLIGKVFALILTLKGVVQIKVTLWVEFCMRNVLTA